MGKLTISTGPFSIASYVTNYQRVIKLPKIGDLNQWVYQLEINGHFQELCNKCNSHYQRVMGIPSGELT